MEESAIRLKQLLDETGMSQQELADKSGVHKSKISKYIKGEYCPKADAAQKMGEVFNVSPVWLMGVEGIDRHNQPTMSSDNSSPDIEKALELYRLYKEANPQVQSAVEILLRPSQSDS